MHIENNTDGGSSSSNQNSDSGRYGSITDEEYLQGETVYNDT